MAQVADMLQVPIATLYQWRSRGDGPAGIKVGRWVRFQRADVDRWLESKRETRGMA